MANEKHLKWLREGVEASNERRRDTPFIPDFRGSTIINGSLIGSFIANDPTNAAVIEYNNFSDLDLSGADVRSNYSLIEGDAFPHPESFQRTKLNILGITQHQLDSMIGDSGTIIPDHLTRPDHWEVLPWHREDAGQDAPETDDTFEDAPQYDPELDDAFMDAAYDATTEKPREYYQHLALNLTREPIRSAAVLGAYGQQLATAAQMYRDANKVNQLPDDLILVEQIGVMFGTLSTTILKQQADSAATIEGLETKIAELEKQLYHLTGELNAVKNSQSEKTQKESGFISTFSTNFAKGFSVTLGTGVAVGILAGAKHIFGNGEDIAQALVDAFNGLFSGPAEAKVVRPQDWFDT